MVHFGRSVDVADAADSVEPCWLGMIYGANRNCVEIRHVFDVIFEILNGEEIIVACLWIDPITGCYHLIGGQSGNDVANDFF